MKKIIETDFEVLTYLGNSQAIESVMRFSDGKTFSIGDHVTNGTRMHGKITKLEYDLKDNEIFVKTDWSGIGMNLSSLSHVVELPCKFQIGDGVLLRLSEEALVGTEAWVHAVHFYRGHVKYDLVVQYDKKDPRKETRVYNVEEKFLKKFNG